MIYTCTLNPSIDYYINLPELNKGQINRGNTINYFPGGKGINVSVVLNELNVESTILSLVGGEFGNLLTKKLNQLGINKDLITIQGETRQNIKIRGIDETDINTSGPTITLDEFSILLNKIQELDNDYLVVAGKSILVEGTNSYDEIGKVIDNTNIKLVVDAYGEDLKTLIKYKPFLIKPNLEELEELLNQKITSNASAVSLSKELIDKYNIEYVLLSLGEEGAIITSKTDSFYVQAPSKKVVNTVGSGDSLLAGFIAEYTISKDIQKSLKLAVAAGSATTFSKGLATFEEIIKIHGELE